MLDHHGHMLVRLGERQRCCCHVLKVVGGHASITSGCFHGVVVGKAQKMQLAGVPCFTWQGEHAPFTTRTGEQTTVARNAVKLVALLLVVKGLTSQSKR